MYRAFLKRIFDVVFASVALILLSPLMLAVALMIYLYDRQPVFFRQERVGANGEHFRIFKFRSMSVTAANVQSREAVALPITPVGKIIRRTNIDELPQLFNILRGDMSIVGPRPPIPSQTGLIKMRAENRALTCKPGLTGLAQINGYDYMPDSEKAGYDGEYAKKLSFWLDASIILRTFPRLARRPPVY